MIGPVIVTVVGSAVVVRFPDQPLKTYCSPAPTDGGVAVIVWIVDALNQPLPDIVPKSAVVNVNRYWL